jgi:hypothetical protein
VGVGRVREVAAGSVDAPPEACEIGAYAFAHTLTASEVLDFEALAGRHVATVLYYQHLTTDNQPDFPSAVFDAAVRYHHPYDTHTSVLWSGSPTSTEVLSSIFYDCATV